MSLSLTSTSKCPIGGQTSPDRSMNQNRVWLDILLEDRKLHFLSSFVLMVLLRDPGCLFPQQAIGLFLTKHAQ